MTTKVEDVVAKCPRISVLELVRILNTDYGTNHRILNLKKDKIALKNLLLHMDNARPHSVKRTQAYLEQSGVQIILQSPYSLDLNLCDRFFFTRLQQHCRAKEYSSGEELYIDTKRYLRALPEDLLLHELKKLLQHLRAVIREAGVYVTN